MKVQPQCVTKQCSATAESSPTWQTILAPKSANAKQPSLALNKIMADPDWIWNQPEQLIVYE